MLTWNSANHIYTTLILFSGWLQCALPTSKAVQINTILFIITLSDRWLRIPFHFYKSNKTKPIPIFERELSPKGMFSQLLRSWIPFFCDEGSVRALLLSRNFPFYFWSPIVCAISHLATQSWTRTPGHLLTALGDINIAIFRYSVWFCPKSKVIEVGSLGMQFEKQKWPNKAAYRDAI